MINARTALILVGFVDLIGLQMSSLAFAKISPLQFLVLPGQVRDSVSYLPIWEVINMVLLTFILEKSLIFPFELKLSQCYGLWFVSVSTHTKLYFIGLLNIKIIIVLSSQQFVKYLQKFGKELGINPQLMSFCSVKLWSGCSSFDSMRLSLFLVGKNISLFS